MGQKINPNILRLGISQNWKTVYFENTNKELPVIINKDMEFLNFISRYFDKIGLFIHNYHYQFNPSNLIIYISYFIAPDFKIKSIKKNSSQLVLLNTFSKKKKTYWYK